MTNNLTPEQIAEGWRHISEIVNEPNYNEDDVADIQLAFIPVNGSKKGKFKITHELQYSSDAVLFVPNDDFKGDIYFYRRLIPALPNQVVISREDAQTIAKGASNPIEVFFYDASIARLRVKLEGK